MSEWISVEDRLPKEGQTVILQIIFQRMIGGAFAEDDIIVVGGRQDECWFVGNQMLSWDFDYNLGFYADDVTHWMPLPESPK